MDKLYLFNAHIPKVIETTHYTFEPISDFDEKYKQWEKENKVSRDTNFRGVEVSEKFKRSDMPKSYFYPSQPKLWDYCALLSLFQARNIFPFQDSEGGSPLFARMGQTYDWIILTSQETASHLDDAVQKLGSLSDRERYIFLKSLMLLFEGEFFTHYGDFRDVWYLQPIELFCRGVYCLDHGITNPKRAPRSLKFSDYIKYCVQKFGYDSQYGQPKDNFLEDLATVRNWVMHGKVWNCSVFSGRTNEFTFYHRTQALLKAFLLSYLDINSFTNRDALIHGIAYGNQVNAIWINR